MNRANVQILVYPYDVLTDADAVILRMGTAFAARYGLSAPQCIFRDENKKPRFDTEGVHFSVSHSGLYWTCAFSDCRIGLDIQQHKDCKTEIISRRFYHPEETAWIKNRPPRSFFDVWTAKESYVKYTGEGITDRFAHFSVVFEDKIEVCGGAFLRHVPFDAGYSMCVCTDVPAFVTVIMN